MSKWVAILVVAWASVVIAQEKNADKNTVDIEAWRAAQEKMRLKQAEKGSELDQLRTENAALKKRVAELEKILNLSFTQQPQRAVKTYGSVGEALAACKLPLNPNEKWTDLQMQKAVDSVRGTLIGDRFQGSMVLASAKSTDKGIVQCTFWRDGKDGKPEFVIAEFDSRYADVLATWKNGVARYSFEGIINGIELEKGDGRVGLTLLLKDAVPGTKPPEMIKDPKPAPPLRRVPARGRAQA